MGLNCICPSGHVFSATNARDGEQMQKRSIWAELLGIHGAVVEGVTLTGMVLQVAVRLRKGASGCCAVCGEECVGYDRLPRKSTWRSAPLGQVQVVLVCQLRRVKCATHGVLREYVPWARRESLHTRAFEDMTAWLATRMDKTSVGKFMQLTWSSVSNILERVAEDRRELRGPLAPVHIGIDEVSYRKGHRYLTVVVDHASGLLIFAAPGRSEETLRPFFESLGTERCAAIELVSMDACAAFKAAVATHCPNAKVTMDPFHVVQWMTKALDDVRRRLCRTLRGLGHEPEDLKGTRYVVLKNQENLTPAEGSMLDKLRRLNSPLFSAHLLKEQLRLAFKIKGAEGIATLERWLASATESGIPEVRKVATSVQNNLDNIKHVLTTQVTNAKTESLNNRIRLITRQAFGFHSHEPLLALAFLKLGGLCPDLPYASATHSG